MTKPKVLSKNKKSSSEKNKNKKNKDGGGLAGMGGLTSLLGALHEEPSTRPQSNIFTDNLDQEMREAYTQPTTARSSSTGSESAGSTPSLTPNSTAAEAPVFNLPNGSNGDGGDDENNGGTKYSLISEIAEEYERVHNGGSLSNGDTNNNILEGATSNNKELNGNLYGNSLSSQQSEEEVPVNENKTKKPRKLIKVSLMKTSKGKNFLSGKEYTI